MQSNKPNKKTDDRNKPRKTVTLPLFGYSAYPSDVPFGLEYFPFSVNGASVALNCYLIPFLSSVLDGLPHDHIYSRILFPYIPTFPTHVED